MRQFFNITKVDDEQRMAFGYASTEKVDSQGEIVTIDAMKKAWGDYMEFGNVREMHGNNAAGVVKEYSFDDNGVFIGVKVVDDSAWNKVKEGVYKGFSIGGQKLKDGYDKVTKTITGLKLTEISLVDRPANPGALISVFKADGFEIGQDPDDETAPVAKTNETPAEPGAAASEEPNASETISKALIAMTPAERDALVVEINKLNAPAPERVPSELRKAMKALAVTEGDEIQKGMYDVSRFSDVLCSLSYLQSSAAQEAAYEADGSSLPAQLADLVQQAGKVMLAMAQEEIGELMSSMKLPDGTPAVTMMTEVIAMSAYAADLKKNADLFDVVKAGARNSASDKERIQKAHDLLGELGADCAAGTEKHDHSHDINKLADIEKLSGELGTLRKAHTTLQASYDTLKKAFDKTPATPKGQLLVVEKSGDINPELAPTPIAPVLKKDGEVDDVATEIKKIHAGGGRSFVR